ncbi:hypothetical protein LIER_13539 [Lithospermum erythrorhizon]|uniref:Glyoxal oxidase N-terminal domain-containing protein n=1 Tax=Lithospermum erythrorhizon TaxID=34254 RepID=A0AAV3PY12_LITER
MFLRPSSTCGRLNVSDNDVEVRWRMHEMPMPRVMGDMLILPTGDILIINGICWLGKRSCYKAIDLPNPKSTRRQ